MKKTALVLTMVSVIALGACESTQGRGNKELVGAGSGAVIGGILGSKVGGGNGQLWATGAGVLVGALLGSSIGRSLDKADLAYANKANQQAYSAPIGETITWNNPESGNSGSVTPVRDGYTNAGSYCREYQQTIIVGGKSEQAYGTACQQPDGSWEIQS